MIQSLRYAALGTGFTFLMTTLGAAMVFFFAKETGADLQKALFGFAAGAMLYVVVEELVPQAHSRAGTCGFVGGFLVMMVLDVALG